MDHVKSIVFYYEPLTQPLTPNTFHTFLHILLSSYFRLLSVVCSSLGLENYSLLFHVASFKICDSFRTLASSSNNHYHCRILRRRHSCCLLFSFSLSIEAVVAAVNGRGEKRPRFSTHICGVMCFEFFVGNRVINSNIDFIVFGTSDVKMNLRKTGFL